MTTAYERSRKNILRDYAHSFRICDCDSRKCKTGKLKKELKRADNLTETILYYARLRSADKDIHIQTLNVRGIIDETIKNQKSILIAAGISVSVDGDFITETDGKSLGYMLTQLLVNVAKYCSGCQIKISAKDGTITVCDNGPGIAPHNLPRITERGFTAADGVRTNGSTGMGLYIVKMLCENLNIGFEVESIQGEGTTFLFTNFSLTEDTQQLTLSSYETVR